MHELDRLSEVYGSDHVRFIRGSGDMPLIEITHPHARALISIYGGQMLSYVNQHTGEDLLYLSSLASYTPGKAIRGGVPICWPWFGADPQQQGRPNHGVARISDWSLKSIDANEDQVQVELVLQETMGCAAALTVSIGAELGLKLTTDNHSDKAVQLSQALHTYFRIGDIHQIGISGLNGCDYQDKLDANRVKTQSGELYIDNELDRVYQTLGGELTLTDPVLKRRILINSQDSRSVVVWNPWSQGAAGFADMEDADYRRFVCVEAANAGQDERLLSPGDSHSMSVTYEVAAVAG